MASGASTSAAARLNRRPSPREWPVWLRGAWSRTAAIRALRAAVVVPGLFALTDQVIGNLQMALFAAFGGFATLVLANFEGTPREKLTAHAGLAVAGSILLIIGTAVTFSTALAVAVTVPVTFAVFFAGIAGPQASGGVTGALLAYVLPAATPGTTSMIPDRLAGWWLASVAGAAAVLLIPTREGDDGLRSSISKLAATLSDDIDVLLRGSLSQPRLSACLEAKRGLLDEFKTTPFRPTSLAAADQATGNAVEVISWCTSLVVDTVNEGIQSLADAPQTVRELWQASAAVLRHCSALFAEENRNWPPLDELEARRRAELARLNTLPVDRPGFEASARLSFHAHCVAVATLAFGGDSVVAARLARPDWLAAARTRWFGDSSRLAGPGRLTGISKYTAVVHRHANLRSAWFINSARGSLALAGAVLVADLSNVQHGFWVVLAALSVLRTNASSTGASAIRAVLGTTIGFAIGAALLLAVGTNSTALWLVLPFVVLLAGYAPGAFPFAVGQAAFTVTVAILFNLLEPVGWHVGLLRIEDVAIGCAVAAVVGALFWPRGMAAVVARDLADGYRAGASYLSHAVAWVSGVRTDRPDEAQAAVNAGLRLDAALRAFIAERGAKHLTPPELWRLAGGVVRLRLTTHAISKLTRSRPHGLDSEAAALNLRAQGLVGFYEQLSRLVSSDRGQVNTPAVPEFSHDAATNGAATPAAIWLGEHLMHLQEHLPELVEPAERVAEVRRQPWWR